MVRWARSLTGEPDSPQETEKQSHRLEHLSVLSAPSAKYMNQELPRRVERAVNVVCPTSSKRQVAQREKETRVRRAHSAILSLSLSVSLSASLHAHLTAVILEKVISCAILMHRCKKRVVESSKIGQNAIFWYNARQQHPYPVPCQPKEKN
jgi:N-glycosylase/DNA lyase